MVKRCVVYGCSNTVRNGYSVHKFPKEESIKQLWTHFVKVTRADFVSPTVNSVICCSHFEDNCYEQETLRLKDLFGIPKRLRLRNNSVPSIYPKVAKPKSRALNEGMLASSEKKQKVYPTVLLKYKSGKKDSASQEKEQKLKVTTNRAKQKESTSNDMPHTRQRKKKDSAALKKELKQKAKRTSLTVEFDRKVCKRTLVHNQGSSCFTNSSSMFMYHMPSSMSHGLTVEFDRKVCKRTLVHNQGSSCFTNSSSMFMYHMPSSMSHGQFFMFHLSLHVSSSCSVSYIVLYGNNRDLPLIKRRTLDADFYFLSRVKGRDKGTCYNTIKEPSTSINNTYRRQRKRPREDVHYSEEDDVTFTDTNSNSSKPKRQMNHLQCDGISQGVRSDCGYPNNLKIQNDEIKVGLYSAQKSDMNVYSITVGQKRVVLSVPSEMEACRNGHEQPLSKKYISKFSGQEVEVKGQFPTVSCDRGLDLSYLNKCKGYTSVIDRQNTTNSLVYKPKQSKISRQPTTGSVEIKPSSSALWNLDSQSAQYTEVAHEETYDHSEPGGYIQNRHIKIEPLEINEENTENTGSPDTISEENLIHLSKEIDDQLERYNGHTVEVKREPCETNQESSENHIYSPQMRNLFTTDSYADCEGQLERGLHSEAINSQTERESLNTDPNLSEHSLNNHGIDETNLTNSSKPKRDTFHSHLDGFSERARLDSRNPENLRLQNHDRKLAPYDMRVYTVKVGNKTAMLSVPREIKTLGNVVEGPCSNDSCEEESEPSYPNKCEGQFFGYESVTEGQNTTDLCKDRPERSEKPQVDVHYSEDDDATCIDTHSNSSEPKRQLNHVQSEGISQGIILPCGYPKNSEIQNNESKAGSFSAQMPLIREFAVKVGQKSVVLSVPNGMEECTNGHEQPLSKKYISKTIGQEAEVKGQFPTVLCDGELDMSYLKKCKGDFIGYTSVIDKQNTTDSLVYKPKQSEISRKPTKRPVDIKPSSSVLSSSDPVMYRQETASPYTEVAHEETYDHSEAGGYIQNRHIKIEPLEINEECSEKKDIAEETAEENLIHLSKEIDDQLERYNRHTVEVKREPCETDQEYSENHKYSPQMRNLFTTDSYADCEGQLERGLHSEAINSQTEKEPHNTDPKVEHSLNNHGVHETNLTNSSKQTRDMYHSLLDGFSEGANLESRYPEDLRLQNHDRKLAPNDMHVYTVKVGNKTAMLSVPREIKTLGNTIEGPCSNDSCEEKSEPSYLNKREGQFTGYESVTEGQNTTDLCKDRSEQSEVSGQPKERSKETESSSRIVLCSSDFVVYRQDPPSPYTDVAQEETCDHFRATGQPQNRQIKIEPLDTSQECYENNYTAEDCCDENLNHSSQEIDHQLERNRNTEIKREIKLEPYETNPELSENCQYPTQVKTLDTNNSYEGNLNQKERSKPTEVMNMQMETGLLKTESELLEDCEHNHRANETYKTELCDDQVKRSDCTTITSGQVTKHHQQETRKQSSQMTNNQEKINHSLLVPCEFSPITISEDFISKLLLQVTLVKEANQLFSFRDKCSAVDYKFHLIRNMDSVPPDEDGNLDDFTDFKGRDTIALQGKSVICESALDELFYDLRCSSCTCLADPDRSQAQLLDDTMLHVTILCTRGHKITSWIWYIRNIR